jgi:hypothetical protein
MTLVKLPHSVQTALRFLNELTLTSKWDDLVDSATVFPFRGCRPRSVRPHYVPAEVEWLRPEEKGVLFVYFENPDPGDKIVVQVEGRGKKWHVTQFSIWFYDKDKKPEFYVEAVKVQNTN